MESRAYYISDNQTIPVTILKRYPEYSLVMDDEGRMYKAKNDQIVMQEICSYKS